jgi:hypothetical protein
MSSTNHSHSAAGNKDDHSIICMLRRRNNFLTEALRVLLLGNEVSYRLMSVDDVDDDDLGSSDDGGDDSINGNMDVPPYF